MKKIVIRLELKCDKCRRKALKIAADTQGVSSVAVEGDQLTVTGDMDVVCLSRKLVKNFRCVNVVSVEELKKKDKVEEGKNEDKGKGKNEEKGKGKNEDKGKGKSEDKETGKNEDKGVCYCTPYHPPPCVSYPYSCVVYDPYGPYPNICSIM